MNKQLLKDPDQKVTDDLLKTEMGKVYPALQTFLTAIISDDFGMSYEWRYYKDGKAWLCKITYQKKTAVWLSVWKGFFKLGFYFTEKTGTGIDSLSISESLKEYYKTAKPIGRLKPLIIDISTNADLEDAFTVLKYKSTIK